jgi:hypothetical protein
MVRAIVGSLSRLVRYPYFRQCIKGIRRGWFPVFVNYPVKPVPRYGYGLPPNRAIYDILNEKRDLYRGQLETFKQYSAYLLKIKATETEDSHRPYWGNRWFSGLDAISLYSFIALKKPKIYLEIGSGNSTKYARQAITDQQTGTRIISIDPRPRAEIDTISDTVIRLPLEQVDLSVFDSLGRGDILFFDGSHCCFMNSDVTVFFLEILPAIPAGMLIHIHDIHLPYDYPPERALHYETEQYLLAAMLLGGCEKFSVLLPNKFIVNDPELVSVLDSLWHAPEVTIPQEGYSCWLEKTDDA